MSYAILALVVVGCLAVLSLSVATRSVLRRAARDLADLQTIFVEADRIDPGTSARPAARAARAA